MLSFHTLFYTQFVHLIPSLISAKLFAYDAVSVVNMMYDMFLLRAKMPQPLVQRGMEQVRVCVILDGCCFCYCPRLLTHLTSASPHCSDCIRIKNDGQKTHLPHFQTGGTRTAVGPPYKLDGEALYCSV